jgi:hypothetical protein
LPHRTRGIVDASFRVTTIFAGSPLAARDWPVPVSLAAAGPRVVPQRIGMASKHRLRHFGERANGVVAAPVVTSST